MQQQQQGTKQEQKKRPPPVPKFETSGLNQTKKTEKLDQFLQEIHKQQIDIPKGTSQQQSANDQASAQSPRIKAENAQQQKQQKQLSQDKLDKISSLFNLKKKENKQQTQDTQIKDDTTKSQVAKKQVNVIEHTHKTLQSNEREEYDPARPNDYEELKKYKEKQKQREKLKSLEQAEEEKEKLKKETTQQDAKKMEIENPKDKGQKKDTQAQQLLDTKKQQETQKIETEESNQAKVKTTEEKALSIMEKFGYKIGEGLGKHGQGITAPIIHMKTGDNSGIMTIGQGDISTVLPADVVLRRYIEGQGIIPTKILVMLNMVKPNEVDDELQSEIYEECHLYGEVSKIIIHIMSSPNNNLPADQLVRIFVEFQRVDAAMQAFQNINGRVFDGRILTATFYEEEQFAKSNFEYKLVMPKDNDQFIQQQEILLAQQLQQVQQIQPQQQQQQ